MLTHDNVWCISNVTDFYTHYSYIAYFTNLTLSPVFTAKFLWIINATNGKLGNGRKETASLQFRTCCTLSLLSFQFRALKVVESTASMLFDELLLLPLVYYSYWRAYTPCPHEVYACPSQPQNVTALWPVLISRPAELALAFLLWSPYGIGQTIIFSCCGLFFLSFFFGQTIIFSCCGLFFLSFFFFFFFFLA